MKVRLPIMPFLWSFLVIASWIALTSATIHPKQVLPPASRQERAASLAEGEPSNEPKSSSELNSETEPNSTAKPEPEAVAEAWPEPGPLWSKAFKTWQSAWGIHVYVFATSYLFMAFYAAYYVVYNLYDGLHKKYLSVSLNIMVLVFCLSRSFIMYLDPYHQGGIINSLQLMRLIWSIGGPCLTASDSLIILALLQTSRLSITLPTLQKASVISAIITAHFVFVIMTDFVVSKYASAKAMILFCQVFFVVWGFVLGTGYIRLGYVLDKQLFSHKPHKDNQDKLYLFLIYASGGANYALVIIMFYTMFGVFGVYSDVKFVDAWSWWALQTVLRFSEVITCILIFTVSAKRTRIKEAMDDIATTQSQVPQNSTLSLTPVQQMRKMFKSNKHITVKPLDDDSFAALPKRPAPRRERRMSMFSHLETDSKAVQGITLESHARASPTGSTNTQDSIDLDEILDTNDNHFQKWHSENQREEKPTPINSFTSKRTFKNLYRNQNVAIDDILEECEGSDVVEEDITKMKPSFVRKISAHFSRTLSSMSTKGDEGESIIQNDGNAVSSNTEYCVGFESQSMQYSNSLPNLVDN